MTVLSAPTRAGYAADWALFTDWCTAADHQAQPATAGTVVLFLTENPAAVATLARRVTAIAHLNRSELAALTTEHLTVDPEKLTITVDTDAVVLPATVEPASCPGCTWILWRRMLHLIDHHAGGRRMADTLRHAVSLMNADGHRCAAPRIAPSPSRCRCSCR